MKINSILLFLLVFFIIACQEKGGQSSNDAEMHLLRLTKKMSPFLQKKKEK